MWKYLYNFSIIYKVKNMEKILVSACLLGDKCKYNGKDNYIKEIEELKARVNNTNATDSEEVKNLKAEIKELNTVYKK